MELSSPIEQTWLANLSFKYLGFEMKTSTKRAIEFGTWSQIMFPPAPSLVIVSPQNKLASLEATLFWNYDPPTHSA